MAQAPRAIETQLFSPSCATGSFLHVLVTCSSDSFSPSLKGFFLESHGPGKLCGVDHD